MLHRRGSAQAEGRDGGADGRSRRHRKKGAIEQAYRLAEAAGIQLWCQDEAGPYQTVPYAGSSWQPTGLPARQPHEYCRDGTTKLLTLFRPATGEVRAAPAIQTTNAVLHPWLKQELTAVLAQCPPPPPEAAAGRRWEQWDWLAERHLLDAQLPPSRLIVVLDNLQGHHTYSWVQWCAERGILLLHTPVGGSWLNLAEAVQRIIIRRALAGQHPLSVAELQDWLMASVRGWNAEPTPFVWGGKRAARRRRARERRHRLGGAAGYSHRPLRRRPQLSEQWPSAWQVTH